MSPFTQVPKVIRPIGNYSVTRGQVRIFLTENPTLMQPVSSYTYVCLGDWLPPESAVAMFVTAIFSSSRAEVNLVYAPEAERYRADLDGECGSVSVQLGTWLFNRGHLTHHSIDRTPAGDRWAHHVGGVIPPLAPDDDPRRGNPEATVRSAERAFAALCEVEWPDADGQTARRSRDLVTARPPHSFWHKDGQRWRKDVPPRLRQ